MTDIELKTESPTKRLTRDCVTEIVAAINDSASGDLGAWNAVNALEILVDAGQYRIARELSLTLQRLVAGDGRQRLFVAFEVLCGCIIDGTVRSSVTKLKAIYEQIVHGNHALADNVRAGVLVSRALLIGVSTNTLADDSVVEARTILNREMCRALAQHDPHLACMAGLEMAKSYLLCSPNELVTLNALVSYIREISTDERVLPELRFEIQQLGYQLLPRATSSEDAEVAVSDLRRMAMPIGAVSRGLAELSISQRTDVDEDTRVVARERAMRLFEENMFAAGTFELLYTQGVEALSVSAGQPALQAFARAKEVARNSGYEYGVVEATLGALQASLSSTPGEVAPWLDQMNTVMSSEAALGRAGLRVIAAMQVAGRPDIARKLARRCELFFAEIGLDALQSQAVFLLGSAHALKGDWSKAKASWRRGVSIDVRRRAPLAAADKRAALAQAIAMEDFSKTSTISADSMVKIKKLLAVADRAAAASVNTIEGVRTRAKVLQTHAQLCMIAKEQVDAIKHLSRARELYEQRGLAREVALADALIGLAVLEVAKLKGGSLFEEAAAALLRALEFFEHTQHALIRWKLKYYLAIAAFMSSGTKRRAEQRDYWVRTASAWLKRAIDDASQVKAAGSEGSLDGDFSPGFGAHALEALAAVLRRTSKSMRPRVLRANGRARRFARQIH